MRHAVFTALALILPLLAACEAPQPRKLAPMQQAQPAAEMPAKTPLQQGNVPVVKVEHVKEIALLRYGSAPQQIGQVAQGEQNPEGPMALDADQNGRVCVLDQVNARAQCLMSDGTWQQIAASRTAQDLAIAADGSLLTLDRLVAHNVQKISNQAKLLNTWPLDPQQAPLTTALFERQGQPWIELEHQDVQSVAPTPVVQRGRLTADGRWLLLGLKVPPNQVAITGQAPTGPADSAPSQTLLVQFKLPVWQIVELAGDAQGHIWLVVDLVQLDAQDMPVQRLRQAVIFDEQNREIARYDLCSPDGAQEQFRTAKLGGNGHLYSMCLQTNGLHVQEVSL